MQQRDADAQHTHTYIWRGKTNVVIHLHSPEENGNTHFWAHCYRKQQLNPPHSWIGPATAGKGHTVISHTVDGREVKFK
jgi:hypothetical protein